jgi:hypothetical protein
LLAVLACVGLACGALWLVQGAFNSVRQLAQSGSSATSTPPGEAPLGSGDGGEFVSIPLESGLPRTVTYSGLSYTVLEAVLENQPRPEEFGFVPEGEFLARLAVQLENTTGQDIFIDDRIYRLRLADGEVYPTLSSGVYAPPPGATSNLELVFAVPGSADWEGAQLELGAADREPAVLPLTGEVPAPQFPRTVALPAPATVTAPDGSLQYELLGAALDLDWQGSRVTVGHRYLQLRLRLTNLGGRSGLAIGPSHFRLLVDGVPLAPEASMIEVVDYQASRDGEAVFLVPASAGEVTLQLGDVSTSEPQLVTLTLDLGGE